MKPYKETGTYIIRSPDEASQLLDDHIVMTQTMSFSPFKKPFEERITNWEGKLRMTQVRIYIQPKPVKHLLMLFLNVRKILKSVTSSESLYIVGQNSAIKGHVYDLFVNFLLWYSYTLLRLKKKKLVMIFYHSSSFRMF